MAAYGYCPSGRLFEAAACGTTILTDSWAGLDAFFRPGTEVLVVTSGEETLAALNLSDEELKRVGEAGRATAMERHTASVRALELENILDRAGETSGDYAGSGQPFVT